MRIFVNAFSVNISISTRIHNANLGAFPGNVRHKFLKLVNCDNTKNQDYFHMAYRFLYIIEVAQTKHNMPLRFLVT